MSFCKLILIYIKFGLIISNDLTHCTLLPSILHLGQNRPRSDSLMITELLYLGLHFLVGHSLASATTFLERKFKFQVHLSLDINYFALWPMSWFKPLMMSLKAAWNLP